MKSETEEFIHFEICVERLGSAWNTLKLIKEEVNNPLRGPAFRFALVEYAIPYNKSFGAIRNSHRLYEAYIPPEFIDLHRRLLASRDQVLAHSDLTALDPTISLAEFRGELLVTRSQRDITGLEELSNIDEIMSLINGTISNMLDDRNRLKLALKNSEDKS